MLLKDERNLPKEGPVPWEKEHNKSNNGFDMKHLYTLSKDTLH